MRKVCQSIRQGFTLIELLVVVAIIVILVSVVVVSLFNSREKANVARFKQVVHSIQTAAIKVCDEGDIDYNVIMSSLGGAPSNIEAIFNNEQDCGPGYATTFNASVKSLGIVPQCTAVIDQTGITSFTGC